MALAKKKSSGTKATPKKAAATKTAAKKGSKQAAPKKAAPKKAAPKKASKKAAPKKASKQAAPKKAAKQTAPKKAAPKPAAAKRPAKSTAKSAGKPAAGQPAAAKPASAKPAAKPAVKKAPSSGTSRSASTPRSSTRKANNNSMATTSVTSAGHDTPEIPKPRFNKDGFGYTKDYDLAFVKEMHDLLETERVRLTGQAKRLEDEAHQLVEEAEMGDVQFDDEGGEGDTMVVERERDLALSAQARETIEEIDAALERIKAGTYGYSIVSGRPIPRERLEAIPWSTVLVEEKVGGIGR